MTREEAIKEIRRMSLPKETMEILKALAPELAESEDERVIKALETFINQPEIADKITFEARIGWLTWLEKQKEPHYTKRNALFDKCVENCDPAVMKEVSDEIDEMLKKEQKPVECIKFDNEFENQVSHLIASVLNGEHEYNEGFVKYAAQALLGYAKKEQKPAGFYVTLNGEKYYAEEVQCNGMNVKVVAPKPAEWSEEDIEKMVNARARKSGTTKSEMCFYRQGIEDTLKSLRPHWKPSEEQMEALQSAIDACESEWAYQDDELRSLFTDLKKLM